MVPFLCRSGKSGRWCDILGTTATVHSSACLTPLALAFSCAGSAPAVSRPFVALWAGRWRGRGTHGHLLFCAVQSEQGWCCASSRSGTALCWGTRSPLLPGVFLPEKSLGPQHQAFPASWELLGSNPDGVCSSGWWGGILSPTCPSCGTVPHSQEGTPTFVPGTPLKGVCGLWRWVPSPASLLKDSVLTRRWTGVPVVTFWVAASSPAQRLGQGCRNILPQPVGRRNQLKTVTVVVV